MNISQYCENNTSSADSILAASAPSITNGEDVCRDNVLHKEAPGIDRATIDVQASSGRPSAGSLVVHLRSGDIFASGFKNSGFGQV